MQSAKANPSAGRTITGVIVHILALIFGIFGAGAVYAISGNQFSKSNAKEALNWQLFFLISVIGLFAIAAIVSVNIVGLVALSLIFVLVVLDLGFCLFAMYRAMSGVTWNYPITPSFV